MILSSDADFDFASNNFTIELRVNFNSLATVQYLFSQYTPGVPYYGLSYNPLGAMYFEWTSDGSDSHYVILPCAISASTWYHIALVRNGDYLLLFVDGTLAATRSISGNIYMSPTLPIYIGGISNSQSLNGNMDEIRISNGIARWISNFVSASSAYSLHSWQQVVTQGPAGATGPSGARGTTGPAGATGPQGPGATYDADYEAIIITVI